MRKGVKCSILDTLQKFLVKGSVKLNVSLYLIV